MDLQQLRSWIFELYEPLENERQYVIYDAERGNLLVDVPPYGERALRLIRGAGRASLLLITNAGRATDAHRYREALGVQVVAHAADASAVRGGADVLLGDDELLRPDARVLRVGGATVLLAQKAGGVLVCGDLDLASPAAGILADLRFSVILSARRPPVWNAGHDELLRLQRVLPKPRRRFGVLLQVPWDRSHKGRLEDQMKPNPLIPTERTVADEAAMGPATLVVARASRDLVERPARPAWEGVAVAVAPSAPAAPAAGRARPRSFQEDWSAPATPKPPTTLANDAQGGSSVAAMVAAAGRARIDTAWGIDLSADGTEVAFARAGAKDHSGAFEVCALRLAGERVFQLTAAGLRSVSPRWSPDARWIAFLRGAADDGLALWLVDRDGRAERVLAPGPFTDLAWSPDGTRLACGSVAGIRLVDAASGAALALTDGADRAPRWSPDGRTLAFARGADRSRALHLVPASGGAAVRLETGGEAFDPSWSPDGGRLAFTAVMAAGRTRVAVATLVGTAVAGVERLGVTPFAESEPRWRADGRGLAYLQRIGEGSVTVRRVFLASRVDTPLADRPGTHASARLGPDSESLVYVLGDEIWSQPKSGVEPRRLT